MVIEHVMEVAAPVAAVWRVLNDTSTFCACSTSAAPAISSRRCERMVVDVPIFGTEYTLRGHARVLSADESRRQLVMHFEGSDRFAKNHADAEIQLRLVDSAGATRVEVVVEPRMVGRFEYATQAEATAAVTRLLTEAEVLLAQRARSAGTAETAATAQPPVLGAERRGQILAGVGGAAVLVLLWAVLSRGSRRRRRAVRARVTAQRAAQIQQVLDARRAAAAVAQPGK